jgi:hypothetical protein
VCSFESGHGPLFDLAGHDPGHDQAAQEWKKDAGDQKIWAHRAFIPQCEEGVPSHQEPRDAGVEGQIEEGGYQTLMDDEKTTVFR